MHFKDENIQKESDILNLKKRLKDLSESDNNKENQIKDLEMKNGELIKKNSEFQSHLQNSIMKMTLITQENNKLKLEIKKLQLSVNSPGKIIASLGTTNRENITEDNLLKEKTEFKETNEKLTLELSEREKELSKLKFDYENEINELNNIITEQKGKINDLNNDMNDMQEQLNSKDNELNQIKEGKKTCDFQRLKIDYDLLQLNFEKNKELYDNLENKYNLYENDNKRLNERAERIEKAFSNLINGEKPKIKDINEFEIYNEISENLRDQITEIQNAKETLEKRYNATSVKSRKDYKALEDKYLELYEKNNELQKKVDDEQNNFINDTMKLNNEISELNDKVKLAEREKDEFKIKYENLLKDLEKNSLNFQNLQNIMTKLREKDDLDITLIEERYIVLENVLELEKNEIINNNRELINKVKILAQKNEKSGSESKKSGLKENKEDKNNNLKLEIKKLTEENKLLQLKIKEKEKNLLD